MRVLHVVPSLRLSGGGPSRSVLSLARAQRRAGLEVVVAGAGARGEGAVNIQHLPLPLEIPTSTSRRLLLEAIRQSDLVEIHGVWNGTTSTAAALCRRAGVRYVLTPRGMLDPACLRIRRAAKLLYGWLTESKTLRGAAAFHFLSEEERERAVVGRTLENGEAVVSPNGMPELPAVLPRAGLASRFGDLSGRRVVLHLGRLHSIKGIDLQILALTRIPEEERPVLLLVGPDYGAWRELRKLARREHVEDWVRKGGEVYGHDRFGLLAEADLVLLTSVYDCNPVVAVEAMAVGGAVLATEGSGLTEAARYGGAVVVPRRPENVASAMLELLAAGERLAALRQRARQYVEDELNWQRVLQPLLCLYDRIAARVHARHVNGF